jgi:tripartite-type tricarboxylate transporter receptor subunit TctC
MKKLFVILLVSVMALGCFAGCGGQDQTTNESDGPDTESEITWPEKPIQIVVGYGPGGDTDTYPRIMLSTLSEELGQPVAITTMEGAAASVASNYVRNAEPDGYTVLWHHTSILTSNIFGQTDYTHQAFAPTNMCVENKSYFIWGNSKWKSWEEIEAYAKENPGKLNVGMAPGGFAHLATVCLEGAGDIDVNYVDVGPAANGVIELLAGRIDIFPQTLPAMRDYLEKGQITVLGCLGDERSEALPDVPTFKELGYEVEVAMQYGFAFPKGTDEAIIDKFNSAVQIALNSDEFKEKNVYYGSKTSFYTKEEAWEQWDASYDFFMKYEKYFTW